MSSFAKFIVNNADGSINIDSTKQKYDSACTDAYHKARDAFEQKLATDYQTALASFETDLQKHTTIHNRWDELSLTYILASFEKFASDKGTIVKPMLVDTTAGAMLTDGKITPGEYNTVRKMITEFIDCNMGTLFSTIKGIGGGVLVIK